MENYPLDITIKIAENLIKRQKTEMADALESDNDRYKIQRLLEIAAAYSVELEATVEVLRQIEMERQQKKFWQFWK